MTRAIATLLCALLAACSSGKPFEGLGPSSDGPGPHVVFDPLRQPFAELPFPNDLATRADGASPTGLRINASLAAATQLERNVRGMLDVLDGFGTFAPIPVSFDADLDYLDLFARQNDSDPLNDAIFVVDLTTGNRVPLDFNSGRFPLTLSR